MDLPVKSQLDTKILTIAILKVFSQSNEPVTYVNAQ